MYRRFKILSMLVVIAMLLAMVGPAVLAEGPGGDGEIVQRKSGVQPKKFAPLDQPDQQMYQQRRQVEGAVLSGNAAAQQDLTLTGEGKALVLLLDFAGTDVVTWNPGDQWDPYGKAEEVDFEDFGDCSNIITQTKTFTYTPTLHGNVAVPPTADAAYKGGDENLSFGLYSPDTSRQHFENLVFGDGVAFSYNAANGEPVNVSIDESLRKYYEKLSAGKFTVSGDVVGWIPLPHSMAWYGADMCPGALSQNVQNAGGADGYYNFNPDRQRQLRVDYGTPKAAVMDAVDWINANMPDFDWSKYDADHNGVIDTIMLVAAGVDEANTGADEMAIWPHSSSVNYCASAGPDGQCGTADDIRTGAYIVQGETTGVATFTHEYGHRLGADDLYSYGYGETSAGIWSNMSDDRGHGLPWDSGSVGMDPWHKLGWGWLNPVVMNYDDPAQVVTLGQAADVPAGMNDAILVKLPDSREQIETAHSPTHMWWGGRQNLMDNLVYRPVDLTGATAAQLTFWNKFDIEPNWDFGFVQVSTDQGATWTSLANDHTTDEHDPGAIDYVVANLPGLTGTIDDWRQESYDLSAYAGKEIWLGFRYATDWATLGNGWWVDDIQVTKDGAAVFSDDVESGQGSWVVASGVDHWSISDGVFTYPQYYLWEWRNDAGIDHNLAIGRCDVESWGLLGWYINDHKYTANEIYDYLSDVPSFGPKGKALVIDSHPQPLRDTTSVNAHNARSNTAYRCYGMRDAAFGLQELPSFKVTQPPNNPSRWGNPDYTYPAQPAVSAFHDSMSYYPGLEYTSIRASNDPRGPRMYWTAKERDASVVVPAKGVYSVKAPGYEEGTGFLQWMPEESSWYGFWDWKGGTGNPGDEHLQYGVHVQVVDQAADGSWGKIKVWNALNQFEGAVTQTPSANPLMHGDTVNVEFMGSNIGGAVNGWFVMPVDSDLEFVSASGGAVPLTGPALAQLAASRGADLAAALGANAAAAGDKVVAVAWSGDVATGDEVEFGYTGKVVSYSGTVHTGVALFDGSSYFQGVNSTDLAIVDDGMRSVELPLVADTWVNGGDPAMNYNSFAALIGRTTGLDNVLLSFDRSLLPAGQQIVSAELAVNVTGQSGQFGKSLVAANVNAFDPAKVTYATAPLLYNPGTAVVVPNANGEVAFDVASQVTAWDAGAADAAGGAQAADSMGNLAVSAAGPWGRVIMDSLESFQGHPATLKITYKIVE